MSSLPVEQTRPLLIRAFFLFIFSLLLTLVSAEYPKIGRIGYSVASQVLYPFHMVSNQISNYLKDSFDNYVYLIDVKKNNDNLKNKINILRHENTLLKEKIHEVNILKELSQFKKQQKLEGIVAEVIARDPSEWVKAITINQGESSGVKLNMPVVSDYAVVGQIVAVAKNTSKVMLITDLQSGINCLIQESRIPAVVKGYGKARPELLFVEKREPVKRGSIIITSGLGDVFPKGLLVGYIHEVLPSPPGSLFHKVVVSPAADLKKIEYVFVVKQN